MPELRRTTFNSVQELGEEIIRSAPKYAGRDPQELGTTAMSHPNFAKVQIVEGFTDIDPVETGLNVPGDVARTTGESLSGFSDMLANPVQTARGLKNIGLGGLDLMSKPTTHAPGQQGALAQVRSMAEGLGMGDIATPEQEAAAREFGSEFTRETVSPAGIQERPALAASNALMAMPNPVLKAIGGLGKGGKWAEMILRAGQLDPLEGVRAAKHGAKKVAAAAVDKAKDTGGKVSRSEIIESLRTDDKSLLAEVLVDAPLAFTTGTSNVFIGELRQRAGTGEFNRLFRRARKAPRSEGNASMSTTAFEMADAMQKKMNDEYVQATQAAFKGGSGRRKMVPTSQFHDRLDEIAEGAGGTLGRDIDGRWELVFRSDSPVSKTGASRNLIKRELEEIANFRLVMPAESLHNLRKRLDDTVSSISDDAPISRNARQALRDARRMMSETLEKHLGAQYRDAMQDYGDMVNVRDNLRERFGIHPGKVDTQGRIDPSGVEQVETALTQAFAERGGVAGRIDVLEEFERIVGKENALIPAVMGVIARELTGQGLVVRSELASLGRMMAGFATGAAALGNFTTAPAIFLFSPRIMSEAILTGIPAGERAGKMAVNSWRNASAAATRINELTGGDLRRTMQREGWDMAMLMEKMEEVSGQDFGDEKSIFKSLGNIRLHGMTPKPPLEAKSSQVLSPPVP